MKDIVQILKNKGYRITKQRKEILQLLTLFPQSVFEIYQSLRNKRIILDKVTIYRTLECLQKLGIVGKIQFNETSAKYELLSKNNHHHHLVCNSCGGVEDISFNEHELLTKVRKHSKFLVQNHTVEFFGLCGNCQRLNL
jgi:Fur family transcriptional regulator, ferric uptake regulator